jgi:hypothetical protein
MDLIYGIAGQIFSEMLGQICYREYYENPEMEYQEVLALTFEVANTYRPLSCTADTPR